MKSGVGVISALGACDEVVSAVEVDQPSDGVQSLKGEAAEGEGADEDAVTAVTPRVSPSNERPGGAMSEAYGESHDERIAQMLEDGRREKELALTLRIELEDALCPDNIDDPDKVTTHGLKPCSNPGLAIDSLAMWRLPCSGRSPLCSLLPSCPLCSLLACVPAAPCVLPMSPLLLACLCPLCSDETRRFEPSCDKLAVPMIVLVAGGGLGSLRSVWKAVATDERPAVVMSDIVGASEWIHRACCQAPDTKVRTTPLGLMQAKVVADGSSGHGLGSAGSPPSTMPSPRGGGKSDADSLMKKTASFKMAFASGHDQKMMRAAICIQANARRKLSQSAEGMLADLRAIYRQNKGAIHFFSSHAQMQGQTGELHDCIVRALLKDCSSTG